MKERWVWKSRWAALGAAVAVSIGAGGLFVAQAAPGASESTIVSVTPARIMDTRDPVNVGLVGPFVSPVSQKLQVTGSVATTTGTQTVVPVGATGVLLNVTAVGPNANGFISVRPGDATGAPATSSLNVEAGSNLPNAVQVALPTAGANAGQIDITYDAYGVAGRTTDILVDVVGYMTNKGIQELVADVAAAQTSITSLTKNQPRIASSSVGGFPSLSDAETLTTVAITVPGPDKQNVYISGQASIFTNSTQALTCSSTSFCNIGIEILDADTNTRLTPSSGSFFRLRDDSDGQSLSISVLVSAAPGTHTYRLQTEFNFVKPEVPFLSQASLTAQTAPLTGTGVVPLVAAGDAPAAPDAAGNQAIGG